MSEAQRRPRGRRSRPAAGAPAAQPAPPPDARRDGTRETLVGALSTRRGLRLAFLLREVLGPPLGLRGTSPDTPP